MTEEEKKRALDEIKQGIELYKQIRALERVGMQASVVAEMAAAVPTSVVRDIVKDLRAGVPPPSSMVNQPAAAVQRGTGWQEPRPLESPPGQQYIDRLMAQEDRQWRAERARQLGVDPPGTRRI